MVEGEFAAVFRELVSDVVSSYLMVSGDPFDSDVDVWVGQKDEENVSSEYLVLYLVRGVVSFPNRLDGGCVICVDADVGYGCEPLRFVEVSDNDAGLTESGGFHVVNFHELASAPVLPCDYCAVVERDHAPSCEAIPVVVLR